MKSFPSAVLKGGATLNPVNSNSSAKDQIINSFTNAVNSAMMDVTSGKQLDTKDLDVTSQFDYRTALDKFDFTTIDTSKNFKGNSALFGDSTSNIENVYRIGAEVFNQMNNYRGYYSNVEVALSPEEIENGDKADYKTKVIKVDKMTPSLFNPIYGVITNSITENVPLLDNANEDGNGFNKEWAAKLSDCSVKELVSESRKTTKNSILGNAKYKYADFMYCKHLGEVSNNHLITLRRYAFPVGDDIFNTAQAYEDEIQPDIARLVTWFGTEDNKLENIMSYDVEATWVEKTAENEQKQSQEEDPARGIIGQLANMLSPTYQKQLVSGVASPAASLLGRFGFAKNAAPYASNEVMIGERYDKNKIYDPINTLRSTHLYEGILKFNQEFNLKFSYKLRAYDNINPKSAFLDLLSNILVMTYKDGNFWGGSRQILGPQTNRTVWDGVGQILDGVKGTAGSVIDSFSMFLGGGVNFSDILGNISDTLKQGGKDIVSKVREVGAKLGGTSGILKNFSQGILNGIIGAANNKLGRPAIYAFSSMLDGSNVGLWHVTVGNPKNPIASFGNMILTKAKITHSGPLGIDDFPTELTVEVSLKHGRPRDSSEIQRMYTKGIRSIYYAYMNIDEKNAGKVIKTQNDYFDQTMIDEQKVQRIRNQFL